ncbi:MAG: homing endonuclease associated repeat-containing protein [Halobacteriales archaeon]
MAENRYSDEQCLDALRAAAERLGRSPARREYASLGCEPSATVISKRFDSWNEAKREAGLPICRGGQPPKPVNESYFEQIDAASKAYWLGFLFGDGSLVERKYGCRVQLSQRRGTAVTC